MAICLCCIAGGVWWDGYYLPDKPCRPVHYPEGTVETNNTSVITSDPIEVVLNYYDQRLSVKPYPAETGVWSREKLSDSTVLYLCYGTDINRLSTETGCIYLQSSNGQTQIQTMLLRSEGGNDSCPQSY